MKTLTCTFAGHADVYSASVERSLTMDIYAKVKYNRPEELAVPLTAAFDLWDD